MLLRKLDLEDFVTGSESYKLYSGLGVDETKKLLLFILLPQVSIRNLLIFLQNRRRDLESFLVH